MLEQTAPAGGGVTMPGSAQEMAGHGTCCYNLSDIGVFSQTLTCILEVFFIMLSGILRSPHKLIRKRTRDGIK